MGSPESPLEELELLLESSPGSLGGGAVGKGCSVAASDGVDLGLGESGGFAGLAATPGNGNCSAVEGFLAGAAAGHGVAV